MNLTMLNLIEINDTDTLQTLKHIDYLLERLLQLQFSNKSKFKLLILEFEWQISSKPLCQSKIYKVKLFNRFEIETLLGR